MAAVTRLSHHVLWPVFSGLCLFAFTPFVFASVDMPSSSSNLQAFFQISVGPAFSSDIGRDQHFGSQESSTGETYDYTAHSNGQTELAWASMLGINYAFKPSWIYQFGLEYNQISSFSAHGIFSQGLDPQSSDNYDYQYRMSLKQLLVEQKLMYTIDKIYHPYAMFGFGVAFNKAYGYDTDVPVYLSFTRIYQDAQTNSYSYAAGLGLDIDLTPELRAGVAYRFDDFGRVGLGQASIDVFNVPGHLTQAHTYVNQVMFQLSFLF